MVYSTVSSAKLNYTESNELLNEDKMYETTMYVIPLFSKNYLVALGKQRTEYANSPYYVVYYPIYLLNQDKQIDSRIGVYEIHSNKATEVIDDDGDVNLTKFSGPLLFAHITDGYLADKEYQDNLSVETLNNSAENDKPIGDNDGDDGDGDDDDIHKKEYENLPKTEAEADILLKENVLIKSKSHENPVPPPQPYTVETVEMAKEIREDYKITSSDSDSWITKLMKNKNYKIHPNAGEGDCFFLAVQEAFKSIGYTVEIPLLRKFLAQSVSIDILEQYKIRYQTITEEIKTLQEAETKSRNQILILKKQNEKNKDIEKETYFVNEGKRIRAEHEKIMQQIEEAKTMVHDYEFMQNIDTLQQLRDFIETPSYYIDDGTMTIFERICSVKCIILVETSDVKTMIQCGEVSDGFQPEYYIVLNLNHSIQHYELVSYKDKLIFKFAELPFDLKNQTVETCLLSGKKIPDGGYYNIHEFKKYYHTVYGLPDAQPRTENANIEERPDEPNQEGETTLFDANIRLIFHSKSDKNKKPGQVSGEQIPLQDKKYFDALGSVKANKLQYPLWRRRLDDSWVHCDSEETLCNGDELAAPFTTKDGKRWASIRHYMIALPYENTNKTLYDELSLSSNSSLSKNLKEVEKELKRQKKPLVQNDDMKEAFRKEALRAKFTQNLDLKEILKLTRNANLMQYSTKGVISDISLMEIREELLSSST
jgi:predicted NAD-dependent protein-ADP-ribosyltransferase YbiA (DUF1768 family)